MAREQRPNAAQLRLLNRYHRSMSQMQAAHLIAEHRTRRTWFKPPAAPKPPELTAARVAKLHGVPVTLTQHDLQVGSYLWAKRTAKGLAEMHDKDTEHWADALLKCPLSSLNHGTVRIAGKPYHWRQKPYTGRLSLAAGESPW